MSWSQQRHVKLCLSSVTVLCNSLSVLSAFPVRSWRLVRSTGGTSLKRSVSAKRDPCSLSSPSRAKTLSSSPEDGLWVPFKTNTFAMMQMLKMLHCVRTDRNAACNNRFILFPFPQNEILYEKKKKRRRLRLRRLGKRPPPAVPQDGQPMDDLEKEMRQVQQNKWHISAK